MQENLEISTIICEEAGIRLDKFLSSNLPSLSRNQVQELIVAGQVIANEKIIKNPSTKTKITSYEVNISYIKPKPTHLEPYNFPLNIVFEDDYLMVINKPSGLTVHPGAGNYDQTLANALVHYAKDNLSKLGGDFRPGIVHRLDKDTTGLIIIAKDDETHRFLSEALSKRDIKRSYLALVYGTPELLAGTIKTKIAKHRHDHTRMVVTNGNGKEAITHYVVKKKIIGGKFSLLECKLDTGRTHQIRVQLHYKGFPVVGDQVYNEAQRKHLTKISPEITNLVSSFNRQALHAYKLEFIHPINEESMSFEINLPEDIEKLCLKLETTSS